LAVPFVNNAQICARPIPEHFNPERIILFGSHASDTADAHLMLIC